MAKFDVYRRRDSKMLVIDCQADLLSNLTTRFVVPLLLDGRLPKLISRLNPTFVIGGKRYAMATQFAAAIAMSELGETVASLSEQQFEVGNALDLLLSGF